jgi:hypothetical protein
MVAPTCFGITLPSSGNVPSAWRSNYVRSSIPRSTIKTIDKSHVTAYGFYRMRHRVIRLVRISEHAASNFYPVGTKLLRNVVTILPNYAVTCRRKEQSYYNHFDNLISISSQLNLLIENCALLGYYAPVVIISLPTFRHNL